MHESSRVLAAALDVGGYTSLWKMLIVFVLLMAWAKAVTFIDKDATRAHLSREILNSVIWGAGMLGYLLFFLLPNFWAGLVVVLVTQLGGLGVYLGMRSKSVGLADLKEKLGEFSKLSKGKEVVKEEGPDVAAPVGVVQIFGKAGTPLPEVPLGDPYRNAYEAIQNLFMDAIVKGAQRIEIFPADANISSVRVSIDGFVYEGSPINTNTAQALITYLKLAGGLDVNERRKPQAGLLKLRFAKDRPEFEIATAGSTNGESMRLTLDPKKRFDLKLDQLGFRPEQLELLKRTIAQAGGVVLVATPKGQGLSTLLYSILRGHDAFLSQIQTLEHNKETDLEGITQTRVGSGGSAAEELKQIEWIISQQVDIIMMDQVVNPATARELAKYAAEGKRIYVGVRSGNTFEALKAWRKLVGDDQLAVSSLKLVIAGRVVRRLCMACKVAVAPDPETLRKLNLDPERIQRIFVARTHPMRTPKGQIIPCEFCHELRFKGRFGVYETFNIDDDAKAAILGGGSDTQLKAAFRKQRSYFLQEMALLAVEDGQTSVQEMLRVMREGQAAARPAAAPR